MLERRVGELDWKRLAVTDEQIADFNLTVIQKYDARTKSYHDAVETEALGQARIVAIVRDRMEELLPEPLADVHEREEAEREEIGARRFKDAPKSGSPGQPAKNVTPLRSAKPPRST
ncbi:MAG TPA: hypothetical protein VIL70_03640 [Chthoniobacterales bacterium]